MKTSRKRIINFPRAIDYNLIVNFTRICVSFETYYITYVPIEKKRRRRWREKKMNHKTCFVSIDVTIIRVQVVKINEAPASCEYILHFKRY